jgi:hypothetical protein
MIGGLDVADPKRAKSKSQVVKGTAYVRERLFAQRR